MAKLSHLKLKYRLYMQAYPYRHIDWRPGAQLRKPLCESKIAVVTSAAFYGVDQKPFDPTIQGGDYSYREIPEDIKLETLQIGHKSDAFDHSGIEKDKNLKSWRKKH
jgi:D-proline reductase (dithiol) PrdB